MSPVLISPKKIHCLFIPLLLVLGAIKPWQWRFTPFGEDLISYLDLGDCYLRGDWSNAVSCYWSPLYSWILALAQALFRPDAYWELPLVRATNYIIFVCDLAIFLYFWQQARRAYKNQVDSTKDCIWSDSTLLLLFYTIFAYSTLVLGGVFIDTPDLLVSGFILAGAALLTEIKLGDLSLSRYLILGAIFGVGYLAKAVCFPIALSYSALLYVYTPRDKRARFFASMLVFVLIAAPFAIAASIKCHHPTLSESGRTSLSWCVDGTSWVHKRGPEYKHPTRIIFQDPTVYEFATPIKGTYPPWFNPYYWYEGAQPKSPLSLAWFNLSVHLRLFLGILIAAFLALGLIARRLPFTKEALIANAPYLVPAVIGLSIYTIGFTMATTLNSRYLTAYVFLLFTGLLFSIRLPVNRSSQNALRALSAWIVLSMTAFLIINMSAHKDASKDWNSNDQFAVADTLKRLGLRPGDKVCHLGTVRYFWARLAKLHIVAAIRGESDVAKFWSMSPSNRERLYSVLKSYGVLAIVQDPSLLHGEHYPINPPGAEWLRVPGTISYIHLIQ